MAKKRKGKKTKQVPFEDSFGTDGLIDLQIPSRIDLYQKGKKIAGNGDKKIDLKNRNN